MKEQLGFSVVAEPHFCWQICALGRALQILYRVSFQVLRKPIDHANKS